MLTASQIAPQFPFEIRSESLNISNLLSKKFDFDVRLQCGDNLQRDFCWDSEQKNALLETILKGYSTIGSFMFIECFNYFDGSKQGLFEVIDGKHRISTILQFYNGEIAYQHEGAECLYSELDFELQRRFLNTPTQAYYVSEERHFMHKYKAFDALTEEYAQKYCISDTDKVRLLDMFSFKGTPQAKEHLVNLKQKVAYEF